MLSTSQGQSISTRRAHPRHEYLIGVSAVLVFGTVRGIGESLVAALVFTHVWLLPGVGPQVCLQVLQARVGLGATLELEGGGQVRKDTPYAAEAAAPRGSPPPPSLPSPVAPIPTPHPKECVMVVMTVPLSSGKH